MLIPEMEAGAAWTAEVGQWPTRTYGMRWEEGRILGFLDGLQSMRQVILMALGTERDRYLAFSGNYGAELEELAGMPASYVIPEAERRIREALTWDSRITGVDGFEFEAEKDRLAVRFVAHTELGEIEESVGFKI